MKKYKNIISIAAAIAVLGLFGFIAYSDPKLSSFLPKFNFGQPAVSNPSSGSRPNDMDPQTVDFSIHSDQLHSIGEPVDIQLINANSAEITGDNTYTVNRFSFSKFPLYEHTVYPSKEEYSFDENGRLQSRHFYCLVNVTIENNREISDDYLVAGNTLKLLLGKDTAGSEESYTQWCEENASISSNGHLEIPPHTSYTLNYIFILPEYWLTKGTILFSPSHGGMDPYQLQMHGKQTQYISLGVSPKDGRLAGLADLRQQTVVMAPEKGIDDIYTFMTYQLDKVSCSTECDVSLNTLSKNGSAEDGESAPDGYQFCYVDLSITNNMTPLDYRVNSITERITAANTSLFGLNIYTEGADGVAENAFAPLASSVDSEDNGEFTIESGQTKQLRLAYLIPDEILNSEKLYLTCVCPSWQAEAAFTAKSIALQPERLFPGVMWISFSKNNWV